MRPPEPGVKLRSPRGEELSLRAILVQTATGRIARVTTARLVLAAPKHTDPDLVRDNRWQSNLLWCRCQESLGDPALAPEIVDDGVCVEKEHAKGADGLRPFWEIDAAPQRMADRPRLRPIP
jgi:hypothetical protein